MGSTLQRFGDAMQRIMGKFAANNLLSAISNGMIRLLAVTMVGSICAILSNLGFPGYAEWLDATGIGTLLGVGVLMTTNLISMYVLIALAHEYSVKLGGSSINAIMLSVMSFFILTPVAQFNVKSATITGMDLTYLGSKGMFVAMLVSLTVTWGYCALERRHITLKMPASVPPAVANSFTALVPAWIIGGVVLTISALIKLTGFDNIHDLIYTLIQTPLESLGGSIWALLFLLFFSELLWFFGIHGSMATSAILFTLYQPLEVQNLAAFTAGDALPNIITKTFIDILKGPRHLALALLLLFVCRSVHMKSVGKIAIIPGIFNISEPMKFGIPMVLNPMLFIPMTMAPVLCTGMAYVATVLEWIPRTSGVTVPQSTPMIGSGLLIGDWRTAILQVAQLLAVMALYYPFIRMLDRDNLKEEALMKEEAAPTVTEDAPVAEANFGGAVPELSVAEPIADPVTPSDSQPLAGILATEVARP